MKVTIVEAANAEIWDEEMEGFVFNVLSTFYFKNAMGDFVWLHTRSRQEALDYIKSEYGGKYALCTARQSKGSGSITCSGSNSRKGFASQLKRTV